MCEDTLQRWPALFQSSSCQIFPFSDFSDKLTTLCHQSLLSLLGGDVDSAAEPGHGYLAVAVAQCLCGSVACLLASLVICGIFFSALQKPISLSPGQAGGRFRRHDGRDADVVRQEFYDFEGGVGGRRVQERVAKVDGERFVFVNFVFLFCQV